MLRKSKAFTLVELIIVVVIIGILGAVSVVGYSNQSTKAKQNALYSEASNALRAAIACKASGDTVNTPAASAEICYAFGTTNVSTNVSGKYPATTAMGTNGSYKGVAADPIAFDISATVATTAYSAATDIRCGVNGCIKPTNW